MIGQEENLVMINEFLEKADQRLLVLALTPQGQIFPANSFPTSSKTKVCIHLYALWLIVHIPQQPIHTCILSSSDLLCRQCTLLRGELMW